MKTFRKFAIVVVLAGVVIFLFLMMQPRKYESTAELVYASKDLNPVNGKQQPARSVISEAGCHAIKRAIFERDKTVADVRFNDIKLNDVELKSIKDDVWEVSGTYSAGDAKSRSRWKAVLNVIPHDDNTLAYWPTEVWSGDDLDQLEWKRK